ncbi:MAG: hypothetical protein AAGA48_16825 [Myxococcota bacterium]
MTEVYRCPVEGPLPPDLQTAIRKRVADPELEASITHALRAMLAQTALAPGQVVEVVLHDHPDALELALSYGSIRETLVCTVG